jgi:hypothetical protein
MKHETIGKARYATAAKVRAFVALARELEMDVAGFEVGADGSIRVIEARAMPSTATDFDRLQDQL